MIQLNYKEIEIATDTGDGNEVSQPTDLSVSNPEPGHIPPSSMSLGSVTAVDNRGECIQGLALEGLTLRRGVTGLLLQREIQSVIVAEYTRESRHPLIPCGTHLAAPSLMSPKPKISSPI